MRRFLTPEEEKTAEAGGWKLPLKEIRNVSDGTVRAWVILEWSGKRKRFSQPCASVPVPPDGAMRPDPRGLSGKEKTLQCRSGMSADDPVWVELSDGWIRCRAEKPGRVRGWNYCYSAVVPKGSGYVVGEDGRQMCAERLSIDDPKFFAALKAGGPEPPTGDGWKDA